MKCALKDPKRPGRGWESKYLLTEADGVCDQREAKTTSLLLQGSDNNIPPLNAALVV